MVHYHCLHFSYPQLPWKKRCEGKLGSGPSCPTPAKDQTSRIGWVSILFNFQVPTRHVVHWFAECPVLTQLRSLGSMDWFKGKFTGKPHISWENLWFPVDFPLNQSIDWCPSVRTDLSWERSKGNSSYHWTAALNGPGSTNLPCIHQQINSTYWYIYINCICIYCIGH
jgi:hypothetical protein